MVGLGVIEFVCRVKHGHMTVDGCLDLPCQGTTVHLPKALQGIIQSRGVVYVYCRVTVFVSL